MQVRVNYHHVLIENQDSSSTRSKPIERLKITI